MTGRDINKGNNVVELTFRRY